MYTVQDHPPSPNDSFLLPPLDSLHKDHVRNQELPQPGDSRPVKTPCQRAICDDEKADDEKVGTVGYKHTKVEQLTDASAIGFPHATNY
jgi:hypothetical protein